MGYKFWLTQIRLQSLVNTARDTKFGWHILGYKVGLAQIRLYSWRTSKDSLKKYNKDSKWLKHIYSQLEAEDLRLPSVNKNIIRVSLLKWNFSFIWFRILGGWMNFYNKLLIPLTSYTDIMCCYQAVHQYTIQRYAQFSIFKYKLLHYNLTSLED